jgi:hypothetical protein
MSARNGFVCNYGCLIFFIPVNPYRFLALLRNGTLFENYLHVIQNLKNNKKL